MIQFELETNNIKTKYSMLSKSILDISVSLLGIAVFLPVAVSYSLFILVLFRTNPIIVQYRSLGSHHFPIRIFKLRTIKPESVITKEDKNTLRRTADKKIFYPLGRFLRKTGIDESPQLLMVLAGKMSLIGPRALVYEDLEQLNEYSPSLMLMKNKLRSEPGISGLWQLERSSSFNFEEMLGFDLEYEKIKSLKTDIKLLIKTAKKIVQRSHLDSIS